MRNIPKIVASLFVFCCFNFLVSSNVHAADADYPYLDMESGWAEEIDHAEKVLGNIKGENVYQFNSKSVYGFEDLILNKACPDCTKRGIELANDTSIPIQMRLGLTGMVDRGVYALFNNPPEVDVVAHLAQEWVPGYSNADSVYADGYSDLQDTHVDRIWSSVRDIAYIGYVLIMIVIGFMIMFRHKIGGQTMVTIGNSIPKLVVSLVLVTFSFAIMGLIIDIGGFILSLVKVILYGNGGGGIAIDNPIKLFGSVLSGDVAKNIAKETVGTLGIGGIVGFLVTGGVKGIVIGGIISALLAIVVLGIVLVGAIKLWITLVKSYLSLIVNVIVSPLAIMASAIPGNESSGMNIFKSALRNVLVFPVAYGIVNLPYYAEMKGISLSFPSSLISGGSGDLEIGSFFLAVAKIIAIYAASSAPSIVKGLIPATTSKTALDIGDSLKSSLGGIPLVGGMFK